MKITVFTSNQPRHISFIESLASVADTIFAVQECTTVFPGQVEDFFRKTPVMQNYFSKVMDAERRVFGRIRFTPPHARHLILRVGDINGVKLSDLEPALESDLFVVFGASFIKGELCDFLISKRAYNLHMGVSPFYRGDSCNFWALYDRRPEYVGGTVHLLSKGLDSGPMLFHALPAPEEKDPFYIGMKAVKATHLGFVQRIKDRSLFDLEPVYQDKTLQMRYSKNREFTDEVAQDYLSRLISPTEVMSILEKRDLKKFLRPVVI